MVCDNAVELLRELQRDTWLPEYNSELIRLTVEEINELFNELLQLLEIPNDEEHSAEELCQILGQHTCIERNKRCLLAYIKYRADELLKLRWECGTSIIPPELREKMSTHEMTLMKEYDELLTSYMNETGVQITDDLEPPKSTKITVRVLKPMPDIWTEEGYVAMAKDTVHHVRRTDVEHWIRQGFLMHTA